MFRLHADISQANKVLWMEVNENKGENLITYNKGKYTLKMCYESQQEETIKKKLQNHMTN